MTQEELGMTDSYNEDILPPPEELFTLRNLFVPSCTEPSPQSGCVVSACTCVLGERFTQLSGRWARKRLLGDRHRLSPIFASRGFGVCLQRGGCPRWVSDLVAVCPRCYPGSVSDPHFGCVETATEQGQARLQGRLSSFAGSTHPLTH